jgi:hypothetical protein
MQDIKVHTCHIKAVFPQGAHATLERKEWNFVRRNGGNAGDLRPQELR